MKHSFVYSNVYAYRVVMNLLYKGRYQRRFVDIVDVLGTQLQSVCDLCFGDTFIANWCRLHGIRWTGVDLNPRFCRYARRCGLNVLEGDLFDVDLPSADAFVMAGSLYHFHDQLDALFDAILQRTPRLILSEPIQNLSSQGGLVGWWAGRSANPGTGEVAFRYNEQSLLASLESQQQRLGFSFRIVSVGRDILIEIQR